MKFRDGYQECPWCHGKGCPRCDRRGWIARCPQCYGTDYITEQDDNKFRCGACGTLFDKAGNIVLE